MARSSFRRRLSTCAIFASVATLAGAGIALASSPVKGASYSGTYKGGSETAISFEISANGKKVIDLAVDTPIKCSGGCGGFGSPRGGTAKISSKGTFKVNLKILGLGGTKTIGTDTVTGKFLKHGEAKGTVASHFNGGSSSNRKESWSAVD